MRFVGIDGVFAKARRFISTVESFFDQDLKEGKIATVLRSVFLRIADIEARLPPDGIEFEVAVGTAAALVSMSHNLNGPVRWYVTDWTRPVAQGAYPTAAPILVKDATSDANNLVLRSSVAGRAVIRIEPSAGVMEP